MTNRTLAVAAAVLSFALLAASCGGQSPRQEAGAASSGSEQTEGAVGAARLLPLPSERQSAGDADLPPGHPPIGGTAGAIPPPPVGSGTGTSALAWTVPAGWVEEPPASSMRKAQYRVRGPGGDGECVVFYFGPGQGGDAMSNAKRWASQFRQADGRPSEDVMKTRHFHDAGVRVLLVEVTGTYDGGMTMTDSPAEPRPGWMLLGAIAEGPDANWFFKFTGPEATVRAQREAFEGMVRSLRKPA